MKIAFLSAANSIHTIRWCNALAARGNKVYLLSQHVNNNDNVLCGDVKNVLLPFRGRIGYYLNAPIIRYQLERIRPDIINAHYASGYGTSMRLCGKHPYILSVWGSDVYEFPYQSKLNARIIQRNIDAADGYASTSICMARQLNKVAGRELEIVITPFGVDTDLFKKTSRESHELFTFGIVKTLESKYGVETLIRAYHCFLNNGLEKPKPTQLLIYGNGDERVRLEMLTKELRIEGLVHFKGVIPNNEVPKVLSEMDVFCLSSNSESFGVSALEAMACELPIIATDVDGFLEVVLDGDNGFIVPRKDYYAMAEKMDVLYRNEALRNKIGARGRARVVESYKWENCVDTMIKIYQLYLENK